MQEYKFEQGTLYLAESLSKEPVDAGQEQFCKLLLKYTFRHKMFRDLTENYGQKKSLNGYCILKAHGTSQNGQWVYSDYDELVPVQYWINDTDGKALALILVCCNPDNLEITSQESLVIHPNKNIPFLALGHLPTTKLYLPGEGYLPNTRYRFQKAALRIK